MFMNIILASTSPRRATLLKQAYIDFEVLAVAIDEQVLPNELPVDYIYRMAEQKAQVAFDKIALGGHSQAILVLTADTIGLLDGQILTKPKDKAAAIVMWQAMSGREHEVWTAVSALLMVDAKKVWQSTIKVSTKVAFIPLTLPMMARYWSSGEPCDKAGGYAIQGLGATWVQGIQGDYTNVVGLPLVPTLQLIQKAQTYLDEMKA